MKCIIHKSIPYTAEEISAAIDAGTDDDLGIQVEMYKDGTVIVDPAGLDIEPWSRRVDDYREEDIEAEHPEDEDRARLAKITFSGGYMYITEILSEDQ